MTNPKIERFVGDIYNTVDLDNLQNQDKDALLKFMEDYAKKYHNWRVDESEKEYNSKCTIRNDHEGCEFHHHNVSGCLGCNNYLNLLKE